MAYNNMFPVGYQNPQMYYQSQYQPVQMNNNNGIIWVQGEAGAKSYMVAPNTTVQLWDSEKQVIYFKSADASGMPSMKILDYKIRELNQPTPVSNMVNGEVYATKEELREFKESLENKIKGLMNKEDSNV